MRQTLKSFVQKPLNEAAGELLTKMGFRYSSMSKGVSLDSFFDQTDFAYKYVKEAMECVEHIWDIGAINDFSINNPNISQSDCKYDSMYIFACEIKPHSKFTRSKAVALTRAFNRVFTQTGFSNYDYPVIVIMRQGGKMSIATCERSDRKDNKGEKVGKVTILRDVDCENLHAGHRQILEGITKNVKGCKDFETLHKRWLKSFSIDVISDAFFDKYKLIYEDIVEYATGKRMVKVGNKWEEHDNGSPCASIMQQFSKFSDPNKAVRDYVKKLMGRLVFIQFLQKKGWMGVPAGDSWKGGDPDFLQNLFKKSDKKDTFIDDVLEPLFNDINTNRIDDGDLVTNKNVGENIKVPYLNGGLFEVDEYDSLDFSLPSEYFEKLFEFFSEFNFTIDENAPDDVEIGVDPEMLGRIFENLLEDNKDKGAFYTPKEIVEFMCRESLIAYLQTGITDELKKQTYRDFVTSHDPETLNSKDVLYVDKKLKDIKICDPAIGSGAFPMGMLRELFDCRKSIEQEVEMRAPSEIKKDIIQNSIYGVDIEKGAVDIARLRFWLSLIIEEDTPHALPNMDFKIMQGNSLLEQFEGVDISGISLNEQAKKKAKRGQTWEQVIAFDEQGSLDNIQNAIREYYNTDDHDKKHNLRQIINDNVRSYIIHLKGCTPEIKEKISNLPIPNDQFFLWHIYFKEVFDNGGFDIVIGNPPYFVYEGKNTGELEALRKIEDYKIALGGKLNAYKLFLAHALKCLVKPSGINCFIFQNSFMADVQAANLRKYTLSNCQILSIDSFPERDNKKKRVFESVKMSVCIVVIRNENSNYPFIVNIWDDKYKSSGTQTCFTREEIESIDSTGLTIPRITEEMKPIILKMLRSRAVSIQCNEGELNVTSHRPYFSTDKTLPVIMKGAGIQRYYFTYQMSQGSIEYLNEREYLNDFGDTDKSKHHMQRRIVMQGMTGANDKIRLIMTIVPEGMYLGHSCKYIMPINELPLECILGIMNSKLANAFFRCFSTNSNVNGYEIDNIPIPSFSSEQIVEMKENVSLILSKKRNDHQSDTSALEQEIDRLVYVLYGLTNKEVSIIDPMERIVGNEDELFQN